MVGRDSFANATWQPRGGSVTVDTIDATVPLPEKPTAMIAVLTSRLTAPSGKLPRGVLDAE